MTNDELRVFSGKYTGFEEPDCDVSVLIGEIIRLKTLIELLDCEFLIDEGKNNCEEIFGVPNCQACRTKRRKDG